MNMIRSSRLVVSYNVLSVKRPYVAASLTSAALFGVGDIVSQQAVSRKGLKNHDFASTMRMTLYGACVFGPVATAWYKLLERHVVIKGQKFATAAARAAADQTLFAPVGIAAFFTCMTVMEGGDIKKKLAEKWEQTLYTNWKLWPFVQLGNFTLVPLHLRLMVVNVVSIGWNAYLGHANSKTDDTPGSKEVSRIEELTDEAATKISKTVKA